MSTLLRRMVERTRTPLSSIHPLAPPPFLVPRSEPSVVSDEQTPVIRSGGSEDAVRPAPASGRWRREVDRPARHRPAAAELPATADRDRPDRAPAVHPATLTTKTEQPAAKFPTAAAAEEGRQVEPDPPARPNGRPVRLQEHDSPRFVPTAPHTVQGFPAREHERAAAPVVLGAADHFADANDRHQPRAAGGSQPVVTISIGEIEVRAGPAAPARAQPQTAPTFRPRVSLDDFLARRQERR